MKNRTYKGKQMTASGKPVAGAPLTCAQWNRLDWQAIGKQVTRLQVRIAQAARQGRFGKVKALQWLLAHSFSAKAWAVRRVVRNRGRNTAGVDGVRWRTDRQKMAAIGSLKRRGYRSLPLRRIYIPKRNGQHRPLSIPTMKDRAMQALYASTLSPVAEVRADRHSYGFRPGRSTADALGQCFIVLAKWYSARWILEGDIHSCFDELSHSWLLSNVHMDRRMLKGWLKAGYMESSKLFPTEEGAPQGGIISPLLANIALDGLEDAVRKVTPPRSKVNVVRYADDFVITSNTKELLENKIVPATEAFLAERGLTLSPAKTHITAIEKGFDFLGATVRKYDGTLRMKPSTKVVLRFLKEIRRFLRTHRSIKTVCLIEALNAKIRGWAYQFRHLVSNRAFGTIDYQIGENLWQWIRRCHPKKSVKWLVKRYYRHDGRQRVFTARKCSSDGQHRHVDLFLAGRVLIIRHVKVRAAACIYDPHCESYFRDRRRKGRHRRGPRQVNDPTF